MAERRKLKFHSLQDILNDAKMLAASEVDLSGDWTLGQILGHLSVSMNGSIDGINDFKPPFLIRLLAPVFMKNKILNDGMKPGIKFPNKLKKSFVPEFSTQEGIEAIEKALQRLNENEHRVKHPILGTLTREQWDQFHLRHAELHLSFARPI